MFSSLKQFVQINYLAFSRCHGQGSTFKNISIIKNMLFNSSAVSTSLAHPHSLCNKYIRHSMMLSARWPSHIHLCLRRCILNTLVLVHFQPTPTFSVIPLIGPSQMLCASRFSHKHLCLRTCYFTPLVLVPSWPTTTVSVKTLFGPSLMLCATRYSHILLCLRTWLLTPLVL